MKKVMRVTIIIFLIVIAFGVAAIWLGEKVDAVLRFLQDAEYSVWHTWISTLLSAATCLLIAYLFRFREWIGHFSCRYRPVSSYEGFAILPFPEDYLRNEKVQTLCISFKERVLVFFPRRAKCDGEAFGSQIWPYSKKNILMVYKMLFACLILGLLTFDYLTYKMIWDLNAFFALLCRGVFYILLFIVGVSSIPLFQMNRIKKRCLREGVIPVFWGKYLASIAGEQHEDLFFCPLENATGFDLNRANALCGIYNEIRKNGGFLKPAAEILTEKEWLTFSNMP